MEPATDPTVAETAAVAGWSVRSYQAGRVLTPVNDAHERPGITVHLPCRRTWSRPTR